MALPALNTKSLNSKLSELDANRQLAFGAICCERLLPNYLAFQTETGWGDITPIRKALDIVWSFLTNNSMDLKVLKSTLASCESVIPDSEDFESLFVSAAQNACLAVCCLLDFLLNEEVDKIVQVAIYATDSVDLYVQELEEMTQDDPEREQKIYKHRFFQRELLQQEKDLANLKQAPELSTFFFEKLKQSWKNKEKSNLDLP